jgi:hypothetical protein
MFAYPAGKYPPFRQWSNLIVLPDSGFSTASSLSQLLNYDSLLILPWCSCLPRAPPENAATAPLLND